MDAIYEQLNRGEITRDQADDYARELHRDAKDQEDREDIIAAGRGHLLRDW
jgi:polyhydroxyalkanoate synthesis regulator phasin